MGKIILTLMSLIALIPAANGELATFAGGCFWCMEPPFDKLDGVIKTTSGYSGGVIQNPSYKKVAGGETKHREVVQVEFNPEKVSYEKLVETFWRSCNPTDAGGQFADRGFQYSTAIFYHSDKQKRIAEKSKLAMEKSKKFKKPIVTPIVPYKNFFAAEEYHQDYYKKNPVRYKTYRYLSGRDKFLKSTWGE